MEPAIALIPDVAEPPARPVRRLLAQGAGVPWRVVLTLADQGVVSVATFLTGVMVSRATQAGFGMYALVLTLWVFAGEAQNSLVATPQMLRLPRLNAQQARRFNGSLLVHQFALAAVITLGLLVASAILFAIEGTPSGLGLHGYSLVTLVTALSVGPIALRSFARSFCFATRDVPGAFALDLATSVLQLAGIAAIFFGGHLDHWWLAVVVLAGANLISAAAWTWMARDRFAIDARRALVDLRRNWAVGRFIFASSMLWAAGVQAYPWMISLMAGPRQAGIWGACNALASLGNPLLMGVQNLMGPAIAHAHAKHDLAAFRRYVLRCTVAFVAVVVPPCVLLAAGSNFLLTHINGGDYAGNGTVAGTLAAMLVLQGISFPTSRGLFSLGRAGIDTMANVGPLVVLALIGPLFVSRHGVLGAAVSLLVAQAAGSAVRFAAFLWITRPAAAAKGAA